ncbi:hypothetical protein PoB_007352000 [Plakobranchus ocellatus]|uniref:Uncharacterized protein n=1 Tax=Plakobranchus ocellatus TaxID=259542 RepID=A0AAV4DSP8_9GAST|nr:hypothetical protein PoB_007352000 [Plakobranchus ocellatus]
MLVIIMTKEVAVNGGDRYGGNGDVNDYEAWMIIIELIMFLILFDDGDDDDYGDGDDDGGDDNDDNDEDDDDHDDHDDNDDDDDDNEDDDDDNNDNGYYLPNRINFHLRPTQLPRCRSLIRQSQTLKRLCQRNSPKMAIV